VSVDFSRAFDKVPHDKLLQELAARGVTGKALQWVNSFLHRRMQAVRTTTLSSPAPVTSGVIQGSVLGPLLFVIYMDTLLRKLDIPAVAYADDLKLMGNLAHVTVQDVQRNIYRIAQWSEVKGMPLSVAKCAVMHYGPNNPRHQYVVHGAETLPAADHFKDLGVIMAADGTFSDHVATVAAKGRRLAGLCMRKMVTRKPDFMMRVFNTYVLPSMLYASSIWSPRLRYEIDAFEAVQRRYTRRITGLRHMSYGQRLHTLQQLSVESACMAADLVLTYKLVHGMLGITAAEAGLHLCAGTTRASGILLQQQHVAQTSLSQTFKFRTPVQWKTVPNNILQCASLSLFKKNLRHWLMIADVEHFG
jgi:hypothetical protein